jgi:VWFA-related protein
MRFGPTFLPRSGINAIAIALVSCTITVAQKAPSGQTSPPPSPAAAGENPQSVPPQSADPSTSAPRQEPNQQQTTPDQQPQPIAPDPGDDSPGRFVFKKQVQEVVLHATVVDEAGHLVTSLDRDAFTVYQNGAPEALTSFRREDVPVAMGIVIDNSGSMRDKREKVNEAVLNLIRASNPQDEVFVVNFGQNSYLDQDFTSDIGLLQTALHQVSTRGSTALYDAVVASAVHLRNNPRLDKKVLLVITDGQDNMSRETLQEAIGQLQLNKGPTVYAIGLTDGGLTTNAREALQNLASTTGGVAFFPQSLDEVNDITRTVAHDLRSQYTLTYKPGSPKIGYQAIRVEARDPGHRRLVVRTRTGYYPGDTVR